MSVGGRRRSARAVGATAAPGGAGRGERGGRTASAPRPAAHEVAGVRITHPDRVVYPDHGVTKLDLARFYEAIADRILPHLRGRPTTLVRCPEGLGQACFYQRHAGSWAPATLRRVRIREKTKVAECLVVDDLPGLIGLVQMGVVEIHTWNSRVDQLEQPDRIVLDLDPDPAVSGADLVAATRLVRDALAAAGLESFVKTTGGKGYHVVVPLVPGAGWEECAGFARRLAETLAAREPARFVATMARAARRGKIFIDHLRNARGATSVTPYSTRARPGAPVSTPVAWKELGPRLTPVRYTVATLPRRLATLRADPWAAYSRVRQRLPPASAVAR